VNKWWTHKKAKTPFALHGTTRSYNLSAVGGEAFYDTDNKQRPPVTRRKQPLPEFSGSLFFKLRARVS